MSMLTKFNTLIQSLEGRDKINVLIEKFGKILFYYLSTNQLNPELAEKMLKLAEGIYTINM